MKTIRFKRNKNSSSTAKADPALIQEGENYRTGGSIADLRQMEKRAADREGAIVRKGGEVKDPPPNGMRLVYQYRATTSYAEHRGPHQKVDIYWPDAA